MSISKQQAKALAEGFLDNIGSGKQDFQPRNAISELFLLAGELVEDAQENLNKANITSSGLLSESIVVADPVRNGNVISFDILMNFYGQFHNKGVKGTRAGSSQAGYSFKNEIVSNNMYNAIAKWIKRAKRSTRSVKKYSSYGKHETKRKKIAEYDNVYATARSIKMYGLKPTGFMDNAIAKTEAKIENRLGAALIVDVLDGLQ